MRWEALDRELRDQSWCTFMVLQGSPLPPAAKGFLAWLQAGRNSFQSHVYRFQEDWVCVSSEKHSKQLGEQGFQSSSGKRTAANVCGGFVMGN
jgi:hypothetical protein